MIRQISTIASPRYPVHIGEYVPDSLNSFLKKNKFSSVFILVDEHTLEHCYPVLVSRVKMLAEAEIIELESGEKNKTVDVCMNVWRALSELGADRKSLLINLGGGVITDLGGFVASAYKRGITFINIPTTLLAQVDASVGGKTGVDLDGLKNEIGLFSEPAELFIYPEFLRTLPGREILSGFAEMLKHGLVADADYWNELKNVHPADSSSWEELIVRSVRIKLSVVEADPHEAGLRRVLNFGHTVGHALETFFLERAESTLLHGEAVAAGMVCEAFLSHTFASLSGEAMEEITATILAKYPPVIFDAMADHRLIELMRHDKKNEGASIVFTLIDEIGKPVINKNVDAAGILRSLAYYRTSLNQSH
ncbi:MAG TPA: 3-dehydroquinate synthase [Bacteroidia bacterium]|nr:3-dehydroquinate synthase [Bacteroidia bacterium]